MKPKTIAELNQIYKDAESADKDLRAEMRTNIQLVSGDHYNRYGSAFWNRLREAKQVTNEQRIRLTKNHIGKITKIYRNAILSHSPGVMIGPKNENEIQDQKAAEMHESVWQDIKERHKLDKKIRSWCKDFVEIGEVAAKIFWDHEAGVQVGWEAQMDEMGQPMVDQNGGYIQSQTPLMSGDLILETLHGFDLWREASCKHMDDSPFLGLSKMVHLDDLKEDYGDSPEKLKFIEESSEDTFRVFNSNNNSYQSTKNLCKVNEYYYRVCAEYPKGYYYITTELGILAEGELPFGIFPIVYEGFDEITTCPRHHSIIKQLRPYQIEVNRAGSKIAEHQVTIGDTKVFLLSGSKPGSGASRPGIRYETISGQPPIIVPGQVGDQYMQYVDNQIAEMYRVADVSEELEEIPVQIDAYALLFRSLKQKKKFSIYSDKFESFLKEVCFLSLRLMKQYASPALVIQMIGKSEQVNIAEFKNSDDLCWQIKPIAQVEDFETKLGKQITLNNAIQYIGPQLKKDDIGKFLRLSPYLNTEEMFSDMTQEYDNAVNDILALDRGEYPQAGKYEDHKYQAQRLINRTKKGDFRFKSDLIRGLYDKKINEHEQAVAMEEQQIKDAEAGFIPSGGFAVACDFYVPDPKNPEGSSKRVRIPSEALQWLLKRLEDQGTGKEGLEQMPTEALAEIAKLLQQGQPGQAAPPMGVING